MRKVACVFSIWSILAVQLWAGRSFNGTSDGASTGTNSTANTALWAPTTTVSSLTFSFWLWQNSWPTVGNNPIILEDSASSDANANAFAIAISTSGTCGSGHFVFLQFQGGGVYRIRHVAPPSAAQWHHYMVVMTSDASDYRLVIDGAVQTLSNCDIGTPATKNFLSAPMCVMSRGCSSTRFNAGKLAQVAVWQNVRLSNNEAVSLASCVEPWEIQAESLILYAPLWGVDGATWEPAGYVSLIRANSLVLAGTPTVTDGPPQCSGVL